MGAAHTLVVPFKRASETLRRIKGSDVKKAFNAHDWLLAIVVTICFIGVGVFMGHINNQVVPSNPSPLVHYQLERHNVLNFLAEWDGPDYLAIAAHGYTTKRLTNFFPVYPLLIRAVNYVVPSALDSALIVSWLALAGAVYFCLKVFKTLFSLNENLEAFRGVAFFILFPSAVFLIATYTESLFALFAFAGIYFALKRRYYLASAAGLLATATHINGAFLVLLIAMILWEERVRWRFVVASLVIGGLGLAGYSLYLTLRFHAPLAFIAAQQQHGWLKYSWHSLIAQTDWLNVVFIILIIWAIKYWWNRRRSLSVYSALFLLIPLVGGQFGGFNRYVLMAFPLQFMLYDRLRHSKTGYPVGLALSAIIWAYFLFQYAGGYVGG